MQWFTSLVEEFPEGKVLQRSGDLSRDQLVQFFNESRQRFASPEFKIFLCMGHKRGADAQDLVNTMQKQVFEGMGIQGDFGIGCLGKVRRAYANDAEMLRTFYEFVQMEEMVLDEAELPDHKFKEKYTQLVKIRERAEQVMSEMKDMSPAAQQAYMAKVFQDMLGLPSKQQPHACKGGACSHAQHLIPGAAPSASNANQVIADKENLPFVKDEMQR